jgi:curved DNA-binding protein CbpA
MPDDFYDLLDVSADASQDEIKRAYRAKARQYHPDVNDDDRAEQQFKAVRRAYEVLTDEEERAAYHRLGHETYVSRRMGGLPTETTTADSGAGSAARHRSRSGGSTSSRSKSHSRSGSRTNRNGRRSRRSDDGDGARYGGRASFSERRRRQRRRRRHARLAAEGGAVVATVVYLAGVALFAAAHGDALGSVASALVAGRPSAATGLDPLAFGRTAAVEGTRAVAFPVGVALFPVGVGAAAVRTRRRLGWLAATLALGPVAGVALPVVGMDAAAAFVVCFALAPACALAGLVVVAVRIRR